MKKSEPIDTQAPDAEVWVEAETVTELPPIPQDLVIALDLAPPTPDEVPSIESGAPEATLPVAEIVAPVDIASPQLTCADEPVVILQIIALDVWSQLLPTAWVTVTSENSGAPLAEQSANVVQVALCDSGLHNVKVVAANHETHHIKFHFDGGKSEAAFDVVTANEGTPFLLTTGFMSYGTVGKVRVFTLWTGLVHRWFAPGGFPARHGNHVTLLANGEEAWGTVAEDLTLATEQVTVSTWWWDSDMEIVRKPAEHMWLSTQERWKNTILERLLSLWSVEKKVLVNQFVTQDGLFSAVNVDDWLIDRAEIPGDGFEYMGIANTTSGAFWASPKGVDFGARVLAVYGNQIGGSVLGSQGLPPFSAPIWVDTTDLPLGLNLLEMPIASWHQKGISIDGEVAFVGGMNLAAADWDTDHHYVYEPRRMNFGASTDDRLDVFNKAALPDQLPAKDYMVRLEGPIAADVEAVFAAIWNYQLQKGVLYADLSTPATVNSLPAPMPAGPNVVQSQLLFTLPKPYGDYTVLEGLLRAIAQAKTYILIEDQYMRSTLLTQAIMARMQEEPDLNLIVITNPINEWIDPGCWQTHIENKAIGTAFPWRFHTFRLSSFDAVDTGCILCIDEVLATFSDHYLHSKLVIIDDKYLEVGSANHHNRSLIYEAELAVAVFDNLWVKQARESVLKEILGSYFVPNQSAKGFIASMKSAAAYNQSVRDDWMDEGFDLNLNGAPVPWNMVPDGFLYPLSFNAPASCLIEDIGADIM